MKITEPTTGVRPLPVVGDVLHAGHVATLKAARALGDYTIEELPEASIVSSWGGRTVVLPYLPGHSTTGILTRAWTR